MEDVKHILLSFSGTRKWIMEFLNLKKKKCLDVTKEVAYKKILRCSNKTPIKHLGRYLDKVKYKLFNNIKVL